ncbi:MAG: hypothetical protein K8J08_03425 [Thermoanaerobaculia bacterium]|nr:hypothetical protein [Thermoanaerobaculia bacterium]
MIPATRRLQPFLSRILRPRFLLGLGLVAASTAALNAQAGQLDPNFAIAGRGVAGFGSSFGREQGAGGVLQPDGRVVIVGASFFSAVDSDFGILRLTTDGQLDTTLGGDGNVKVAFDLGGTLYDAAVSAAVDSLGRIVVLGVADTGNGQYNTVLARLLSHGTLDNTFGVLGRVVLSSGGLAQMGNAYEVALQSDGKILVLGAIDTGSPTLQYDCAVVRLTEDGSLDTTFAGLGFVQLDFGESGSNSFDLCPAMRLLPDGRITVAGSGYWPGANDSVLARLMPNGSLDSSLGGNGHVRFNLGTDPTGVSALDVDGSGRAVVTGVVTGNGADIAIARLLADGTFDSSFGGGSGVEYFGFDLGGGFEDSTIGVVVRPNGKILVGGSVERNGGDFDFLAMRLEENGDFDLDFGFSGFTTVFFDLGPDLRDMASTLLVRPNGDLLVAGTASRQNFIEEEVAFTQLLGNEALFEDGFESGNLSGWSSSSP